MEVMAGAASPFQFGMRINYKFSVDSQEFIYFMHFKIDYLSSQHADKIGFIHSM